MKQDGKRIWACALLLAAASGGAQAALQARDLNSDTVIDAYYDTDRDITWQRDANLMASNTFGLIYSTNPFAFGASIYSNGTANWSGANQWIAAMNAANYLGYSDWRLPSALNSNGSGPCANSPTCTDSEMGHLFYGELGGDWATPITTSGDPVELAKFNNIQADTYWSGTPDGSFSAWTFNMGSGSQDSLLKGGHYYSWAVRTGDIAAVPEPETWALMLAGLGLVGGLARRRAAA